MIRGVPSPVSSPSNSGACSTKTSVLVVGAEPHHPLDSGPVVPRPVEQNDLARRGQVLDVALEVPFPVLALARFLQSYHRRAPGVQVLGEAFDRPALASRVSSFEEDDDALARVLDPVLQLQQLDLELPFDHLVVGPGHPLGVGVALPPGVDETTVLPSQHRLVIVVALVEDELVEVLGQVHVDVEQRSTRGNRRSRPGCAVEDQCCGRPEVLGLDALGTHGRNFIIGEATAQLWLPGPVCLVPTSRVERDNAPGPGGGTRSGGRAAPLEAILEPARCLEHLFRSDISNQG